MTRLALLTLGLSTLSACGVLVDGNSAGITYDLQPMEFTHEFAQASCNQPPCTLPTVACTQQQNPCNAIMLPQGAAASCESGSCIASYGKQLVQAINLSQQQGFPSSVANSSVLSSVTVGAVHYWTPTNTLNTRTPETKLYVGPQTAMKATDAGVKLLATVPPLEAGKKTSCKNGGDAGTQSTACDLPLTDEGKAALSAFAKEFRTPFNVIVATTMTVHGGETMPQGKIDLFVQPSVEFVLFK